jgi:hypothetical protein
MAAAEKREKNNFVLEKFNLSPDIISLRWG